MATLVDLAQAVEDKGAALTAAKTKADASAAQATADAAARDQAHTDLASAISTLVSAAQAASEGL